MGFRGNGEVALRGGSGHASAIEEHSWIGRPKRGYPNTEEWKRHSSDESKPSTKRKKNYGNAKIVLSIRSGIDRRGDDIWMRWWLRSTHQYFISPSRHMQRF